MWLRRNSKFRILGSEFCKVIAEKHTSRIASLPSSSLCRPGDLARNNWLIQKLFQKHKKTKPPPCVGRAKFGAESEQHSKRGKVLAGGRNYK